MGAGPLGAGVPARLIVRVSAEEYEQVVSGEADVLVEPLATVEIQQADGLLSMERRPVLIEGLSQAMIYHLGLPLGRPAIRVQVAREEAEDG